MPASARDTLRNILAAHVDHVGLARSVEVSKIAAGCRCIAPAAMVGASSVARLAPSGSRDAVAAVLVGIADRLGVRARHRKSGES
jgi:hypothetical protein